MKYPTAASLESSPGARDPFLFAYQKPAFQELFRIATAFCQTESWQNLLVRPRWHRLIIGPTGTGKTHLAAALAHKLGWPLLSLTVPDWILLGCNERGARQTWRHVAEWLTKRDSFSLIFIDEIDKISGSETWSRHLRTEIFDLLDGRVPTGLRISDDHEDAATSARLRLRATSQLASKTLILGASAFQEAWDNRSIASIGFNEQKRSPPVLSELTQHLQRELLNRFASRIIRLRALEKSDYQEMITETARDLPPNLRVRFSEVGHQLLEECHRDQKGARFVEEILSECLLFSAEQHPNPSPEH
jgi:SpoVK/Ycf46/Vps4 family AAA+-type ATPase